MTLPPPSSATWPIAAAMLPFPDSHDAPAEVWTDQLAQVAFEGFTEVDLTDSWVRVGDLSAERRHELAGVLDRLGLRASAVSAIRRSVIDPDGAAENLAYSHRVIDAAADLGVGIVSVGLHRPLTSAQRDVQWFWVVDGPEDDTSESTGRIAADRIRELGSHAADRGVELSLEMYEDTLIGTVDGALRLVSDVGLANVGLNPDLGNLYRLHRDIEDFIDASARCAPHANYWHVKSYFRDADPAAGFVTSVPAPMAYGSMNYRTAIVQAVAAGFRAPFCVEHYGGDGLTVAAANRDYLRRILAVATGEAQRAMLTTGEGS